MEGFSVSDPPAGTSWERSLEKFRQRLDFFVFFHLGADADVRLEPSSETLQVTISHRRVRPMRLTLAWGEIAELVGSPEAFERYMLGQLTHHRR